MSLLDDRINNLEDVPDDFIEDYLDALPSMLLRVVAILAILELIDGKVVLNEANQARITEIGNQIETSLAQDPKLNAALVKYARSFRTQEAINQQLFTQELSGFQQRAVYNNLIEESQKIAIEALGASNTRAEIVTPIKQFVNNAINSQQSFASLVSTIESAVLSSDAAMIGNIQTASRDFFSISDAAYTIAVSNDLGIEWYLYTGQTVKDSRAFCLARKGKIFHKSEIQKWALLDWQGKIDNTDASTIFIFRGGFNCLDLFMPVDESNVPADVLARIK